MSDPANQLTRAKELLTRAGQAYRKTHFTETVGLCRDALQFVMPEEPGTDRALLLDRAFKRMTEALDRSNKLNEATTALNEWQRLTERNEGRVDILGLRARVTYRQGNFEQAVQYIDEGTSLAQTIGYAAGMAALLRYRADVLWMRGETEQALIAAKQALAIYDRLDDLEGRARTLNTISAIYHMMGNFFQSIHHSLRAITILERLGDQLGLCVVYANTGESYQKIYAMQTALFYHQRALEMCADASPDLLRNLGVDLVAVGRTEEGLARLREALDKAREIGDKDSTLQCLHSLAEAVFSVGEIEEAHALATHLLAEAQPLNAVRHIIRAVLILGYCARAQGDESTAQEYFHEGFMTAQHVSDKTMIWQIHAALAEMLAEKQPDQAAVHVMIAQEMLNSILLSIEDEQLQGTFRSAPQVARVLNARRA